MRAPVRVDALRRQEEASSPGRMHAPMWLNVTRHDALEQWWFDLGPHQRTLALALRPGQHLDAGLAAGLRRYGVAVPRAAVAWDVPGPQGSYGPQGPQEAAVVHVQPRALSDFLAEVRSLLTAAGAVQRSGVLGALW
ncbi:hypothetical protein [Kineococcus sp. SYSU DK005]|uniref:hypothetical protein n=1 Tax=Kineococcus sp. SYSU DK005 TaxID=3383126 RepID=UPI003D7EB3C4